MKKQITQAAAILMTSFFAVGCSAAANSTQASDTVSAAGTIPVVEMSTAVKADPTDETAQPSPELSPAAEQPAQDDTKILKGHVLSDGIEVPIQLSFQLTNIQRGEAAYKILSANQPDLPAAEPGMEYIIITLQATYDSGEVEPLSLEESHASLDAAKLYFTLSNGDSNSEQFTSLLPDSFYNLVLNKGTTGTGSVAFLHRADNHEPLRFFAFGTMLEFSIDDSLSENIQEIEAAAARFLSAYFEGDVEALKSYLTTPYEWHIDTYSNPDAAPDLSSGVLMGISEIPQADGAPIYVVSARYKNTPADDTMQHLTMEFVQQDHDWKIQFYGLEE